MKISFCASSRAVALIAMSALLGACAAPIAPWYAEATSAQYNAAQSQDALEHERRFGHLAKFMRGHWLGFLENGRLFTLVEARWVIPGVVFSSQVPFFRSEVLFVYEPSQKKLMMGSGGRVYDYIEVMHEGSLMLKAQGSSSIYQMLVHEPGSNSFKLSGTVVGTPLPTYRFVQVSDDVYQKAVQDLAHLKPSEKWEGSSVNAEYWAQVAASGGIRVAAADVPALPVRASGAGASSFPGMETPQVDARTRKLSNLGADYTAKALQDPDRAQVWLACGAAASKRVSLPKAQADTYVRKVARALKRTMGAKSTNPCPDSIPANAW